jgi:GT2 family glycosyltransferase
MVLVSVVVPTYNRLARLKHVLLALKEQSFPADRFEVVVVSDGSSDGTHAYLESVSTPYKLTKVIQANRGPAAARNQGVAHATGEYILFLDDDVVPTPSLIAEHMDLHARNPQAVVLGPMLSPNDFAYTPWVAWEQAMLMKQYDAMNHGEWQPTPRQFYTGNSSLRRRYLLEAGGFDERYRRAEDIELAYRLEQFELTFLFNPRAIGYHYAERSYASWSQTPYHYGRNDVKFARTVQPWVLEWAQMEFRQRNRLTRTLVYLCLDRPGLSEPTQRLTKFVSDLSYKLGGKAIAQAGYSAIFNLRYYQGVADELGGRASFFQPQAQTTRKPA